jgi:hypothetical protein
MPFRPPAPGVFNHTSRIDQRTIHIEENCPASQSQRNEMTSNEAYPRSFAAQDLPRAAQMPEDDSLRSPKLQRRDCPLSSRFPKVVEPTITQRVRTVGSWEVNFWSSRDPDLIGTCRCVHVNLAALPRWRRCRSSSSSSSPRRHALPHHRQPLAHRLAHAA